MERPEFRNEPFLDFSREDIRSAMMDAIRGVESQLGREYPAIIGGKSVTADARFRSINPSRPDQVVGVMQKSTSEMAVEALQAADRAFCTWSRTLPERRAECLFKIVDILKRRRMEFAAWMIFEVGKSWVEADADIAEAIDLVEWYGREALRYGGPQPVTPFPGEKPSLRYIPLGVGAIIPPWNFPVAIMMGMTTAAIACGNTVVLKPSSDAPTCAAKFMEVLEEAGVPSGVVNFVPGSGREVGETLVTHPRLRFISFTGSKDVGLRINRLAAEPRDGQIWIKRVVAEMGGKNAIIVDEEADLDAAALGVMASAYGYQGQKCSACSRAIVLEKIYDEFLGKLVERVRAIKVGDPTDPSVYMGPVINESAMNSILGYIEVGRSEGQLILGGGRAAEPGYFIEPTIFTDIKSSDRIAQEEIFGPVLAIIKARDFDHALEIANDTEYGLTGSVYSRNREKLERAAVDFHVGNLYFNRKSTGAMVGAHPFGGFNMSGTDSKAGGRDYLALFTQAKSISEKVA